MCCKWYLTQIMLFDLSLSILSIHLLQLKLIVNSAHHCRGSLISCLFVCRWFSGMVIKNMSQVIILHISCVIVKFHHIMNMHDQFMGMNTIQQPLLSCCLCFTLWPFLCLVTFLMFFTVCVLFFVCFGRTFLFVSRVTANIYLRHRHSIISNLHSAVELSCCSN